MLYPEKSPSKPDISVSQVYYSALVSAIVTAFIAISLGFLDKLARNTDEGSFREKIRQMLRAALLAFSDVQLISSMALIITLYIKQCEMTVYHYNLVNNTILLANITHCFSLVLLTEVFRARWILSLFRGTLIIVVSVASAIAAWRSPRIPAGRDSDVALPAACYLSGIKEAPKLNWIGIVVAAFSVIAFFSIISTWTWMRKLLDRSKWGYWFRLFVQAFLPFVGLICGLVALYWNRTAILAVGEPGKPGTVHLADDAQREWSFGQILPMAVLLITILFTFEQWPSKFH